ncbi:helix-turn-helix domain-containing protein [Streptomyces sp. NPDC001436]
MDSQQFLIWLAKYFPNDILALRVSLILMGTQEPGGLVRARQQDIADELDVDRVHVNRVLGMLYRIGVVHMVKRGVYQLNPKASLRGGTLVSEVQTPFGGKRTVRSKIDQLELISALDVEPKVAAVFKDLTLPEPPPRKVRKRRRTKSDEETTEG